MTTADRDCLEEHPAASLSRRNPFVRYCQRFWTAQNAKRTFPPYRWVPKYRVKHLVGDIIAGLTVGLTVVPQGLAYAKVANLPLQYGLYTALMGPFIYCLFGTSKDITVGPTAVISLLVASSAASPVAGSATYAVFTAFFVGLIHIVMSLLNLGFIVQFISHPVISAFTSAAAVTIISTQIKAWLGLKNVRQDFFGAVYDTCSKLPATRPWDATLGLLSMVLLIAAKQLKDRLIDRTLKRPDLNAYKRVFLKIAWVICIGRNACVVMIAASVAAGLQASNHTDIFTLTPNVVPDLPPFSLPEMSLNATAGNKTITKSTADIFQDIGAGLPIIALMCILEHIAVGKAFARKNGYRLIPSQEILALGLCNFLSSFFGSYPITGSVSRTAVNAASGVMTPAGGIVTGVVVILAVKFLTPYFVFIPQASLAAVIICACGDMIDIMIVRSIWKTKKVDLFPFFVTFLLSFPWGIEYGIIIGTGVNLLMSVYPMSRPHMEIRRLVVDSRSLTSKTMCDNGDVKSRHIVEDTVVDDSVAADGDNGDSDGGSSSSEGEDIDDAADVAVGGGDRVPVATLIRINPGLEYPGVEYIYDKMLKHGPQEHPGPQSVVLDCVHCSGFDYTTVHALETLGSEFGRRKLKLILVHLREDLKALISKELSEHVAIANTIDDARRILLDGKEGHDGKERHDDDDPEIGARSSRLAQPGESVDAHALTTMNINES